VFLIFACVLGCMLGNFGAGINIPINGQMVTFKSYIPAISVPGEMIGQPWFTIGGAKVGLYNSLFTTFIIDAVIVVLVFLGRRGLSRTGLGEKPRNWFGNAWEAYVELLYKNYIVPSLGARARTVLPIAVTIFTFIMIAGFFALVPGHESFGVVEPSSQAGTCAIRVGGVILITGEPVKTNVQQDCPYSPVAGSEHAAAAVTDVQTTEAGADGSQGVFLLPFLRRPTSDLSTALALALIAFLFIEIQGVRANGIRYFGNFFRFNTLRHAGSGMTGLINYIQFGVGFLELLSEFIRIISFSFRLFGNMFAGSILVFVMAFIVPFVLPTMFLGLEFAVAIIQAFVFMMLIVVFTSLAVAHTEH
jgi:F-type H+-transporting ATPase subunit a